MARAQLEVVVTVVKTRVRHSRASSIGQEVAAWQGLETGTIRLGAFASAATRVLPGLLRAYAEHNPRVEVIVQEGTDDEVRQWITVRAVDVGGSQPPADMVNGS